MKSIGQMLLGSFTTISNDDNHLVTLVVDNRDHAAFEQLVNRYKKKLYNFIYFQIRSAQDTEDLLQDTFVELYKSLDKYNRDSQFNSYLYAIAKNVVFNHYRTKSRRITTEAQDNIAEVAEDMNLQGKLEISESMKQLQLAVSQLNVEERQILYLCDNESMSYQQISVILDINLGTVRSRLHNIRKRIVEIMSENKDELR